MMNNQELKEIYNFLISKNALMVSNGFIINTEDGEKIIRKDSDNSFEILAEPEKKIEESELNLRELEMYLIKKNVTPNIEKSNLVNVSLSKVMLFNKIFKILIFTTFLFLISIAISLSSIEIKASKLYDFTVYSLLTSVLLVLLLATKNNNFKFLVLMNGRSIFYSIGPFYFALFINLLGCIIVSSSLRYIFAN
jgi:hypothetical protein